MKKYLAGVFSVAAVAIITFVIFGLSTPLFAQAASTYVRGYLKSNGTYVQGYYRTTPNNTRLDNYSTKGDINPYTGKIGTVNPYKFIVPKISTPKYTAPTYKLPSYKVPTYSLPTYKLPSYKITTYKTLSYTLPSYNTSSYSTSSYKMYR